MAEVKMERPIEGLLAETATTSRIFAKKILCGGEPDDVLSALMNSSILGSRDMNL